MDESSLSHLDSGTGSGGFWRGSGHQGVSGVDGAGVWRSVNLLLTNQTVQREVPKWMVYSVYERIQVTNSLMDKPQKARNAAKARDRSKEYKAILARAFRGELGTTDPQEESALELVRRAL